MPPSPNAPPRILPLSSTSPMKTRRCWKPKRGFKNGLMMPVVSPLVKPCAVLMLMGPRSWLTARTAHQRLGLQDLSNALWRYRNRSPYLPEFPRGTRLLPPGIPRPHHQVGDAEMRQNGGLQICAHACRPRATRFDRESWTPDGPIAHPGHQ